MTFKMRSPPRSIFNVGISKATEKQRQDVLILTELLLSCPRIEALDGIRQSILPPQITVREGAAVS